MARSTAASAGLRQAVPHRPRRATGVVVERRRLRLQRQRALDLQQSMQTRADREALLGQRDRRVEQARPGQPAMACVRHLEHAHGAGHADRAAADHRLLERHRLAVGLQEQPLVGQRRRGLAAVEGFDARAVPMQDERAAADAAGLRLDQREHHLHRHRRIDRRATGLEHLMAGLGGQRVGRGNGEAPGAPAGLDAGAGSRLRLQRRRVGASEPTRRQRAASGQRCQQRQPEPAIHCLADLHAPIIR